VPVIATITFVLAAPVINPVVLLSTAVAFQGSLLVVALRFAMTLSVALTVGSIVQLARLTQPLSVPAGALHDAREPDRGGRPVRVLRHAVDDYAEIMFFIVIGALVTAAAQALVPRGDIASVGSHPILSVAALMPLASLLSICSEADAFVARGFLNTFSPGSVLAFMVFGQIVDLRNGLLLAQTVGPLRTLLIAVVSSILVFVEALAINLILSR
jgi:hypothetical protein